MPVQATLDPLVWVAFVILGFAGCYVVAGIARLVWSLVQVAIGKWR